MKIEKWIRENWIYLVLVFTFFLLFGKITLDFGIENFDNDAKCVVHKSDKIALELDKENYLGKIDNLNKELNEKTTELNDNKSEMSDLQSDLINLKEDGEEYRSKYEQLTRSYDGLNKQLNQTKELLKKEQTLANQNAYLKIPNYECKDCDEIKEFETSFDQCQKLCNENDSCDLINYYAPKMKCVLVKGKDYKNMDYSSYDMYLKTNRNNVGSFDLNELMKLSAPKSATISSLKPSREEIERKKQELKNEMIELRTKIAENIFNSSARVKYEIELNKIKAEYNKL
jgi:chromosome segregation ATPase